MNKKLWFNLMMAVLVAGLFMTVSCAKKTVVSESATVEDQSQPTGDLVDFRAREKIRRPASAGLLIIE